MCISLIHKYTARVTFYSLIMLSLSLSLFFIRLSNEFEKWAAGQKNNNIEFQSIW